MLTILKIFKDELIINKKIYLSLLVINAALIILLIFLNEMNYLGSSLESMVIGLTVSQPFVIMMSYRNSKSLLLNSKLPLTLLDVYVIRFIKVFLVLLIWIVLFFLCRIAGYSLLELPIVIVLLFMSFGLLIFTDMKIYAERYGIIKRAMLIISPKIVLVAVNVVAIFFLKKIHGHMTYDLLGTITLFVILAISASLSYQVFKLRKNYKK